MLGNKKLLVIGLVVPILVLLGLVFEKSYILRTGVEVEFPIQGYDPRDLLSGHYLIYTIDYGVKTCQAQASNSRQAYVCINPREFSEYKPQYCDLYIKGSCEHGRFKAGVERFYATEFDALRLQDLIRQQSTSVVLVVTESGKAQVKYLIIGGQRWQPSQ